MSEFGEEMSREEKVRAREMLLIGKLEEIKRELIERCRPINEELMCIRENRGENFLMDDGRIMRYTGPRPPYFLPEER